MTNILVNLSTLISKSTGISNYTKALFPHLTSLSPIPITSQTCATFEYSHILELPITTQGTKRHFDRLVWTQFQLPKIYRQLKSQLIFSPVPEAPLWSQCRHVVMVHDFIPLRFPQRFSPLTPYHRYYVPQVLRQAKHIICNSQSTADDIIKFCQIPSSKISPILLGYDSQHFQASSELGQRSPNPPYVLYIGRHNPYKNISRVISAFACLQPKN